MTLEVSELKNNVLLINKEISEIKREKELIRFLEKRIKELFRTDSFELRRYHKNKNSELENFFDNHPYEKVFINDIVFIEENCKKFDKEKIVTEFKEGQFLAVPITSAKKGVDDCYGTIIL